MQEYLHTINGSHGASTRMDSSNNKTPSALLDLLHRLPFRMAEVLERPESAKDILIPLSAITTLAECCDISFARDEPGAAWQGVTMWLARVPEHFNQMVGRDDLAALVVLAYRAAILFKRAERVGCWLLKGSAKMIVLQIMRQLSVGSHTVVDLVEYLMAMVNA